MSFKIIEGISLVFALILGALWYLNPEGSFEALSFMALLLGVTITDYIRRHYNERKQEKTYEILLGELARLFEEKIDKQLENADSKTEARIKSELIELFPKTIKEAINLLAKANHELYDSKSINKKTIKEYPVKSLAEAYGIESSAIQIHEMSIFEAKGNRAKSKKNAK